jgi:hypothetical protein
MLAGAAVQGPFEWITSHIQLVGWGTVLLGVYKGTKFLTKVAERLATYEKQAAEAHLATRALQADTHRLVELAEQQGRRWETYMMGKAMNHGGHVVVEDVAMHDIVSEQPDDL